MKRAIELFVAILWILIWIKGIVIAKGFWSTFFAVSTGGLWSLYLILEKILIFLQNSIA